MKIVHIISHLGDYNSSAEFLHSLLPYKKIETYIAYKTVEENLFIPEIVPIFSVNESSLAEAFQQQIATGDIIHFHTVDAELCKPIISYIKNLHLQQKIIWTVQDGFFDSDLAEIIEAADINITFVSTSKGLTSVIKQKLLSAKRIYEIPLPVRSSIFFPGNKLQARKVLGLPEAAMVVACKLPSEVDFYALAECIVSFRDTLKPVWLICWNSSLKTEPSEEIRCFKTITSVMQAEYLRAADFYIEWDEIVSCNNIWAAAACGCPAFVPKKFIETKFLAEGLAMPLESEADFPTVLRAIIKECNTNDSLCKDLANTAMTTVQERGNSARIFMAYQKLYSLLEKKKTIIFSNEIAEKIARMSITELRLFYAENVDPLPMAERARVVENFCLQCLKSKVSTDSLYIWKIVSLWLLTRKDTITFSGADDRESCLFFLRQIRSYLDAYFRKISLQEFWKIDTEYAKIITMLWSNVFFELKSVLNIESKIEDQKPDCSEYPVLEGYPYVFISSMYTPYYQEKENFSTDFLMGGNLPESLRFVITRWLTMLPFYNAEEKHRKNALFYIENISRSMIKYMPHYSKQFCDTMAADFMGVLWRLSYLGGDNTRFLHAYGDFLQGCVKQFYPEFSQPIPRRKKYPGEKIRIGYVSMRFRHQAVSFYMANRILCHDKEKFYVKTFILNKESDEMTKNIEAGSDEFVNLSNISPDQALAEFAKAIRSSDLDILIYADIGMDNVTYPLGAMHLAPVQAVLVGHGTTTGLSSIHYYISGDHEPKQAQKHYVEKLITLPRLGCVQIPPEQSKRRFQRSDFGLPEDAIVFISCANGLKHIPSRDQILVEILQKVPNAYIVLKPFQNLVNSDMKFIDRIKKKAAEAGVENRLLFIPALQEPGDLMGLLVLADIQMDTYPYGGWTTNLEALYHGLPIITQEGNMARSRWGAGLLRSLGIREGIAANEKEYVKWAITLAENKDLRQSLHKKIEEKAKNILFNGPAGQAAYEKALLKIYK